MPTMNFGPLNTPSQPGHLTSRFSPITPDVEGDVELATPTGQSPPPLNDGKAAYKDSLHTGTDDYFSK